MAERSNVELFNQGQVTPKRLQALLRLLARRRQLSREGLLTLLQPPDLSDNTKAAGAVFAAAVRCNLIIYNAVDDLARLSLEEQPSLIETSDGFRAVMQEKLCGVTDPDKDNYLLNQVMAWYAVQLPDVYKLNKRDIAAKFNRELYPQDPDAGEETGRAINDTKLNGWNRWASFLGWGLVYNGDFWPVAHIRLLPKLASLRGRRLIFSEFMQHVADSCPELDGGLLFEQCWRASRPSHMRSKQLSFMLSATLGTLHGLNYIKLEHSTDALDRWQIYQSTAYPFAEVTNIFIAEQ